MVERTAKPLLTIRSAAAVGGAFAALIAIFACIGTVLPATRIGPTLGTPGADDFVQYWAGFRILNDGGNPYDGVRMHEVQRLVGQSSDKTVLMWNPPWLALLLAPVLALPFSLAALCWIALDLAMLMTIARIAPLALNRTPLPLIASALSVIVFYPVLECIRFGQLSVFLAFSFTLFLYFVRVEWFGAAALALIPLTAKPHLFLLFIPPGFVWLRSLSPNHRRRFLGFASAGALTVVAITTLLWPHSIANWIASLSIPPSGPGVVAREEWKTATLANLLRTALTSPLGESPAWPMQVIPALAFLCTTLYFWRRNEVEWSTLAPPLLCISLTTSGYGWAYDQSLLVLCQIALLCKAMEPHASRNFRAMMLTLLVLVQGVALFLGTRADNAQHYYVWIPWAYLILLMVASRKGEAHAPTERSASA